MDPGLLKEQIELTPTLGFALLIGLGALCLTIALIVRTKLVRSTKDFIASGRKIGLGFGVGSMLSVWTWSVAVLFSAALTFQWGLSGLIWFVVPNGFAVMIVVPFAQYLRKNMPHGYTISDFISSRFNSPIASTIVTLTMIFGILLEILINLKGTSVVLSTIFSIDWRTAAIAGAVIILTYSYFGGLWTSVMTGTLNIIGVTILGGVVIAFAIEQVGGAPTVFNAVAARDPMLLSVSNFIEAGKAFGITLCFGFLAVSVADQIFWQKVWAIKPHYIRRSFLWAGALFYPIPITLGILGLIGLGLGITLPQVGGDAAAVGPYVMSHIGLPTIIVVLYVIVILACCYSTIDGGSSALSSVVAIDIVKRIDPRVSERTLFVITKLAMLFGGVVALSIALSGVDFATLVLTSWSLKTAILLPLLAAIMWPRTDTRGFVGGVVLSILIGMSVRYLYGELAGTLTILGISGGVVLISGLFNDKPFDIASLRQSKDELDQAAAINGAGSYGSQIADKV